MPLSTSIRPPRRRAVAVALASALCLTATAWPSAASADYHGDDQGRSVVATTPSGVQVLETSDSRRTCTAPQLVPAFASLGDTRDYVLAPGGSFEERDLDGWQVQRARVVGDGSPLDVDPADEARGRDSWGQDRDGHSLTIPAGGSATSPAMCVDLHYPTFRLMTKARRGQGALRVEVVYPDSDNPVFHPVGSLTTSGDRSWQASSDMPVLPERGGAAPGMRRVALRFTSTGTGGDATEWRIDDLYVDPKRL